MAIRRAPDTEAVYSKQIKKTLRAAGIRAFRIDEIHHLENIDQRILKEIDKSHCVVADLTYARPSVYFEAGYAEKIGIPVIYTCRRDHLSGQGDHRVHFDVRQRPIVEWSNVTDRTFVRRLRARAKSVAAPLIRAQQKAKQESEEEEDFLALSHEDRRRLLRDTTVRSLRATAFRGVIEGGTWPPDPVQAWNGYSPKMRQTCAVVIEATLAKSGLRWLRGRYLLYPLGLPAKVPRGVPLRARHLVVVSLAPVPVSRIESVFYDFTRDRTKPWPVWSKTQPGRDVQDKVQAKRLNVHLLADVRSARQFIEMVYKVFREIRRLAPRQ